MTFRWLKQYMPRGLYGRAALIMLLPVITTFLVVSVVFVQRHFEGVTKQMTISVSREVRLVLSQDNGPELARVLGMSLQQVPPAAVPDQSARRWYDLTGGIVIREFTQRVPDLRAVVLPDHKVVRLFVQEGERTLMLEFDRRRSSAANPHQLFVNMLIFGALMTVIAYFYMRNQLRPITRLAHAAEAFGRGQRVPYHPGGATEVRAAGNAFLSMRARIERQIEQRTLMLSGVSHDLRTPLTRLKLELSMLDDADAAEMRRDVDDMEHLLDGFLAFARGTQDSEMEEVDPVALITAIVNDCLRANLNVALTQIEGAGTMVLRAGAVRRAVENLITNAVRYGSLAEVSVHLGEKSLRIRVEDNGPGIPADQRDEAIKPFARLEPARNQNRATGVGLGLSITNDVARAHGGLLRLGKSERLGGLQAELVIPR